MNQRSVERRCAKAAILSSISMLAIAAMSTPASAHAAPTADATAATVPATVQSAPAVTAAEPVTTQTAAQDRVQTRDGDEDVVVTGSRVIRNGFAAPTPLTVLNAEVLRARADINIADAVNQLPQTANSVTQTSQPTAVSGGALGVNQISLRGLGPTRTLILLDGKRVINSSVTTALAAPDVNHIPNALVTRVDVVTGGASAAYGSDALSGVVNFVLDHNFTGIKGDVTGGVTTYGDNLAYLASLTAGSAFGADGRGHITVSGEIAFNDGVDGNPRPWERGQGGIVVNPARTATNGQPFYLVTGQIGVNNATPGGVITAPTALRGTLFGAGGAVSTYDFGTVTSNNAQIGGDWQISRLDTGYDLVAQDQRHVLFGRLSYEFARAFNVYGEYQFARSRDTGTVNPFRRSGNVTIQRDNAFLPQSVRDRMTALGITSFTLGTTNADIGRGEVQNIRRLNRWTIGADGRFDIGSTAWSWDAYYQQSRNVVNSSLFGTAIDVARYNASVDAVVNSSGTIVCRSTLTTPGNGCVPYNALGTGVNGPAALNYIRQNSTRRDVMKQDVAAANLSGEPFSTWAGPVSIAIGAEHRRERVSGAVTGNVYLPTNGAYHVTEGYAETVVPLARDLSFARALDFNGAVRVTDYSTSGRVTTWKLGAVYEPVSDIRFRATRSRDIRAPNIGELFALGQIASGANIVDPFNNNAVYTSVNILRRGNPLLKPEVANTLGLGVVLTPSFVPRFQASVDFYKIDISGAVKIPNEQIVVNLCFQNPGSPVCAFIERAGNVQTGAITQISTPPANVLSQDAKGIDAELSYRVPLAGTGGNLSFNASGNYVISLRNADTTGVSQGAGVVGNYGGIVSSGPSAPRFRSTVRVGYDDPRFNASLAWRFVSANVIDHRLTECSSACPANNVLTINDNSVSSSSLFDAAMSYKPFAGNETNLFVAVDNILNSAPPFVPGQVDIAYFTGQYTIGYDRIGRTFRAGLRFRL